MIHLTITPIVSTFDSIQISPLWWALSLGANFGGNGTLIGSSVAIIAIGLDEKLHYGITFNRFIKVGFPFMVLTVLAGTAMLLVDVLIRNMNHMWHAHFNNGIKRL